MAVDTRDKRFSMMGLFQPVPALLPNPDGTIDQQDRAMFRHLYHGIILEVLAISPSLSFGVYGFISTTGQGVEGEISAFGSSVNGEITDTFGVFAIISGKGKSVSGDISNTGVSVSGEL